MAFFHPKFKCNTDTNLHTTSFEVEWYTTALFEIEWHCHKQIIQKISDSELESVQSAVIQSKFADSSWCLELRKTEKYSGICVCLVNVKNTKGIIAEFSYDVKAKEGEEQQDRGFLLINLESEPIWVLSDTKIKSGRFWHGDFFIFTGRVKLEKDSTTTPFIPDSLEPVKRDVEYRYTNLLETGQFSDVTLRVGDREFKVHRNILATSCDYFMAMFTVGLKESNQKEIELTDVTPDIFEVILKFIYGGELPEEINVTAKDLLITAGKYGLQAVVTHCENHLSKIVNLENCVELLVFADTYSQQSLKKALISFMRINIRQFEMRQDWEELKNINLKLAFDVLEAICFHTTIN